MEQVYAILLWGCLGILIYIYAGYILILQVLVRWMAVYPHSDESVSPSVSILFSARNEIASLPSKMASIRKLNYPQDRIQVLIASDASTDGTDAYLAAQSDVLFLAIDTHGGKNAALNELLPMATGEILFFTDANTIFDPDSMRNAVKHFRDPRVGAVAGELILMHGEDWNAVDRGVGVYWRYENRIKQLESRLGSLLVGGGSLLIARRDLVQTLDPRIANDLEIPMRIGSRGFYVLYESECRGFEKAHTHAWEELGRTSRIVARGFRGFLVLLPLMIRNPMRFWQFISHKLLRWFTLPFSVGVMVGAWGLSNEVIPRAIFTIGSIGLLATLAGMLLIPYSPQSRWARLLTLLAHMSIMHTAAIWGVIKALFGKTPATWSIPQSTRKPTPPIHPPSKS